MQESDLHTKRTGHTEFVDKTSETAKPISLEVPKGDSESQEGGTSDQNEGGGFYNKLSGDFGSICVSDLFIINLVLIL
jgi:hypothetical protein